MTARRAALLLLAAAAAVGGAAAVKQVRGGVFNKNQTLFFRDSPMRVDRDMVVEAGVTLVIESGVELKFDPGVGIVVKGTLYAVAGKFSPIKLLPYQQMVNYEENFPRMRLVDGPSTRRGRLQLLFDDEWRAVCSKNTNWTSTDFTVACKSMGFSGGGFWRWYRRNNDTHPFVMPRPGCQSTDKSLWHCANMTDTSRIALSEGLCQGEDDLGLVCWGPPSFDGWRRHWKGIQFVNAPYEFVRLDPDGVSVKKQSLSRLEYVQIAYAGYDKLSQNSTAAILVRGMAPFMNGLDVTRSARDGIRVVEPDGEVLIANSTVSHNRGHGISVLNTTDGRVFINETRVQFNYGDGIRYRHRVGSQLSVVSVRSSSSSAAAQRLFKRQTPYYNTQEPQLDFCFDHSLPSTPFPHFVEAFRRNGTQADGAEPTPCYLQFYLERRYEYAFTFQFVEFENRNPASLDTKTTLEFCIGGSVETPCRGAPRYSIPVHNGVLPQSVTIQNIGVPLWVGLVHKTDRDNTVFGDVRVKFRIHATAQNLALYGLNVTNSLISHNMGRGILAEDVRDRTVVTNVSISHNQHLAGIQILNGAGDVWINNTNITDNWGDGINISYVGGAIMVNGTRLSRNRLRGAAFHHNSSSPFFNLRQDIQFEGKEAHSLYKIPTFVDENGWGGILVGNFCANEYFKVERPRVSIDRVQLIQNRYHPAVEYHSCQADNQSMTIVEVLGTQCESGTGYCFRAAPAVNIDLKIDSCEFQNNHRAAMVIRNSRHPQLTHLPARVEVTQNIIKFNRGPFIVHIGLNEDAPRQSLRLAERNVIQANQVFNPYKHLNPRSTPYAVVVVSSSNVHMSGNCFNNPTAAFEMATDLPEHAKLIDARLNSWGETRPANIVARVFDHYRRYTLAEIQLSPFYSICNKVRKGEADFDGFLRGFQAAGDPSRLGGVVYGNEDLAKGVYRVVDDLQIVPGATLNLAPGTVLQFDDGIGLLVQGELSRADRVSNDERVVFTKRAFEVPLVDNIRLAHDEGLQATTTGRLEVRLADTDQWGTVCNRSWSVQLAGKACNQLGMALDPEFRENWLVFSPPPANLPMLMANIRCEEDEWDITRCRHDGPARHVNMSCEPWEVVGLRCVEPRWAGVRYTLMANPLQIAGHKFMKGWTIERAGLLDYSIPEFSAALQIDWNYHTFTELIIRDNFWNGLDIVYNDLTKKPTISRSSFVRNRRHGIRLRSVGLTLEDLDISDNENAGVRYNPIVSARLQRDVVSWLLRADAEQMRENNVFVIPDSALSRLSLSASGVDNRKFLYALSGPDCPLEPVRRCSQSLVVEGSDPRGGWESRVGVQIVNRPHNESDENVVFRAAGRTWDLRRDLVHFPLITDASSITVEYSRSFGPPAVVVLFISIAANQHLDRFVHVQRSRIASNQYGVSTLHYSNFSHWDGSVLNRWDEEKLWFQKINFTQNKQAVVWVNGPLQDVHSNAPIAQITYHIDNCSISLNNGSIIETHRDLYSSANVFHWKIWQSTVENNYHGGISIALPDTYDLLAQKTHRFEITENRFLRNQNFQFELSGYYAFVNISSNNFTENRARDHSGLMLLRGMEKELIMERNRWSRNKGYWLLKVDIRSQALRVSPNDPYSGVPARIQYNYLDHNYLLTNVDDYVDSFPRSFAIGVFGLQKVDIHFNRLRNLLMDFEVVAGLKGALLTDSMNVSFNWWGTGNPAVITQRVFDFDDWNIYALADFNPYFVSEENFIDWWWNPLIGQQQTFQHEDPDAYALQGRLFTSLTMKREREKWSTFPFYYKPDRPYHIIKDLTIMPGATLTIEKGVEVHLFPNVRILVLGTLKAEGTFWEPIRFRPINVSEMHEVLRARDIDQSRWKRSVAASRQAMERQRRDIIYQKFPLLSRQDSFYQKFESFLVGADTPGNGSGYLEIWNATTGELVPICDRQFTTRNAEVVCRELGRPTRNAYAFVAPRWHDDPRLRLIKSYSEPRQCFGHERRLADCDLRLSGRRDSWICVDALHFVFIHCGAARALHERYVAHWGGIMFSATSLQDARAASESRLSHVEIVGAGMAHNDSSSALTMIYQTPFLDHVNVTNSSRDAIQILAPRAKVTMRNLNVTHNLGLGMNVLTLSLPGSNDAAHDTQMRNISFAYNLFGVLDLCSVGKEIRVRSRILVYFKYDSYPADCVKLFRSENGVHRMGFRLLQANLYDPRDPAGRPDAINFYDSVHFTNENFISEIRHDSARSAHIVATTRSALLGVHLRATAADGAYGFLAEVYTVPVAPDVAPVHEVIVLASRFTHNDRGALHYVSAGEKSPDLYVDSCYFGSNGYQIWANFTTSKAAAVLNLHNTLNFRYRNCMMWKNQGGLRITAQSSTAAARLSGLIKDSVFAQNENFDTLRLEGKNFQKIFIVGNYFGKNRARYHDVVYVNELMTNFTKNVFHNNTGLHTVDLTGYPGVRTEYQTFSFNHLTDNIALGHGYQYASRYGFLPDSADAHRRLKRQAGDASFDWWAHVGADTERYRSTILAGSSRQHYTMNFFSNPLNDFELTTVNQSLWNVNQSPIQATLNYWGYPGTAGVAGGKIRDYSDYNYLIEVDYLPVLESNTSLIDGDCPAGWFQAGASEFKSCFLFFGGAMPYNDAERFCEDQGAIIPYFRPADERKGQVAAWVDKNIVANLLEMERFSGHQPSQDIRMWTGGSAVAPSQCGYLSSRSADIGSYNCERMLPFICEFGSQPYGEPFFWRSAGIVVLVAFIILLLLIICLVAGWWFKSRRRKQQFFERKDSLRASLRSTRQAKQDERMKELQRQRLESAGGAAPTPPPRPASPADALALAHRNLVLGPSVESLVDKKSLSSGSSLDTTLTDTTSVEKKRRQSPTYSESAYRSDYSPTTADGSIYAPSTVYMNVPSVKKDLMTTFKSPDKFNSAAVAFRPKADGGRRRDTDYSQTGTYCSTCPTESTLSSEPTRDSRATGSSSYTGSTITERSSTRSSAASDDTVQMEPEPSRLRGRASPPRTPPRHAASASLLDQRPPPYDASPRWARRPGAPPPAPPSLGAAASIPDFAYENCDVSRDNNWQDGGARPLPSRSLTELDAHSRPSHNGFNPSERAARQWPPPQETAM